MNAGELWEAQLARQSFEDWWRDESKERRDLGSEDATLRMGAEMAKRARLRAEIAEEMGHSRLSDTDRAKIQREVRDAIRRNRACWRR